MEPGVLDEYAGKKNVLLLHPVDRKTPAVIAADLQVPAEGEPKLSLEVTSDKKGDFLLKVFVQDKLAKEQVIDGHGKWGAIQIDLSEFRGKKVPVRIENHANGWEFEAAYLGQVTVK
jgi:hypothetical protein